MKPIEERADLATMHALRCVQFRIPKADGMRGEGYVLALGLRYGLMGVAAFHHLLITTEDRDQDDILMMMDCWAHVVEDHAMWELASRWDGPFPASVPEKIGEVSGRILLSFLPLYQRLYPLDRALHWLTASFITENKTAIEGHWYDRRRKLAGQSFRQAAADSIFFAKNFFERRRDDLEEVPEIALIGD